MVGAPILLLASPLFAPQLLAFPHRTPTAIGTIWSEQALDPAMMRDAIAQAQRRIATSPLATTRERRSIFITEGGWRWAWLTTVSMDSFTITRPLTDNVVINATDPHSGIVRNGDPVAGERALGGVLAHEFTHGLIRRHFGELTALRFPQWKVEGYCDYVAGESSLSDADAARLEATGIDHPALAYYRGRHRVASVLARNGGSVDELFNSEP